MVVFNSFIKEFPLILFTLIAQSAVGLSFLQALNTDYGVELRRGTNKKFGFIFLSLVFVGFLVSCINFGDSFQTPYTLERVIEFYQANSWTVSWFPIEIYGITLMVLLAFFVMLYDIQVGVYLLPIIGAILLFAMADTFCSMSHVSTLNLEFILLLFYSSSLFLGSLLYRFFIASNEKQFAISSISSVFGVVFLSISLFLYSICNILDFIDGDYFIFIIGGLCLVSLSSLILLSKDLYPQCFLCNISLKIAIFIGFLGMLATRISFYGLIGTNLLLG